MNWSLMQNPITLVATLKQAAADDFWVFLLLCFVAATALAVVVFGAVLATALHGARKARAKTMPGRRVVVRSAAPARPVFILYASETGNARGLATAAGAAAQQLGLRERVADMAATNVKEVAKPGDLLVIASTWGEGEPPQRAVDFYRSLMADDAPRFERVRYAVLALGDRSYASFENFCRLGREIDRRLAELGAERMAECSECDADYEAQATEWIGAQLGRLGSAGGIVPVATGLDQAGISGRANQIHAIITEKTNLNGAKSSTSTYHVTLSPGEVQLPYEPGDALGIFPENDPELVADVLAAAGLSSNLALRDSMRTEYDITSLTYRQIVAYAGFTGDAELTRIAASQELAEGYLKGDRQLIDMMAAVPAKLSAEQLTGMFRRLQPRLYSIASSRRAASGNVDLLIGAVSWEAFGRTHKGVASMYVAERCRVGNRLRVYLNPNPHFRLPTDPGRNIIMVGPGTGVAPFRAFMQERAALGARGRNWLFFGNRNRATDFLYQAEWEGLSRDGVLNRLDLAFSRDQPEKIYVQHRMWEARRDLYAWLQDGATLYVSGALTMARDVDAMMLRIAADQGGLDDARADAWLADLRHGGRYLRDAY